MKLPMLAVDKANHVTYGALIATAISVVLVAVQTPVLAAALAAAAVVAAVGVGKELRDRAQPESHTPDWRDAAATVAGGALVVLPLLVVALI